MPQGIVGQRCLENKMLPGHGVDKIDATGQQGYGTVRIAATGTILEVALNGTAHGRELTAYLMMTSRQQVDFQHIVTL